MPDRDQLTPVVRAARAGDESAFAALVRAYQDVAVAYATALLGDPHLAEDAAQEAFVDAWRALPALREPAAFAAWLRTIVFKHCDRVTRRRRIVTTALPLDAARDVPAPTPSPHELVEAGETRASLQAAIATLPDGERAAVLLHYMGGRSHAAVAEFLGVTANAVKTRLYAARRRLRRHMEDIADDLRASRPSRDPRFAERVRRMIQPPALRKREPLLWSPGIGTDVWELFCACVDGDLATVRRLVERDPALARCNYAYRTPIYFAVREDRLDVARYLLDHGADPLGLAVHDSLLDVARDRGHDDMARLLEAVYASRHGASPRGEPVAAALRARDLATVRRLLDADATLVHAGDAGGSQPIHWATMTRNLDAIDELVARGADLDARRQDGARPIHLTNGDYGYRGWRDVPADVTTTPGEVYRHLVQRGATVDINMAAATGDIERVRALLAEDPSLANRVSDCRTGYTGSGAPLRNAAARGHLEIVRLLLAHGADPNLPEEHVAPKGHALYEAAACGHHEIAELLLAHGAYPNPPVESSADALSRAMSNGDERMVALLCAHGAARSVDILSYHGDVREGAAVFAADPALADDPQALAQAAAEGHEPFVRLMLHHHPDLARRLTTDRFWSVGAKTRALAELLFAHGMDPSHTDWLGATPLHHFARTGNAEMATLYLDHGADLHARDDDLQSTPLGWAAKFGRREMAELLLARGAVPELPDDPAWATPLAWATRRGHGEIVALLRRYGASP